MDDIKKAYAWQEALELSCRLIDLIDQFSDGANNVLAWHLRQAVVEIPASIASDLQANRYATLEPVAKLAAELELIPKIYPAIDASEAEEQMNKLLDRMHSENFAERKNDSNLERKAQPDETTAVSSPPPAQSQSQTAAEEPVAQSGGPTVVTPQVDGVSQVTSIDVTRPGIITNQE